jgi:hypothetical protein
MPESDDFEIERRRDYPSMYTVILSVQREIRELKASRDRVEEALVKLTQILEHHIEQDNLTHASVLDVARAWRESKVAWKWIKWITVFTISVASSLYAFTEWFRQHVK